MSILKRAKKVELKAGEWKILKINPSQEEVLQKLGIVEKPEEKPKQKRGQPRMNHIYSLTDWESSSLYKLVIVTYIKSFCLLKILFCLLRVI